MKSALLDLNILTALIWPVHEHHEAAHRWFRVRGTARWATCAITQLGFVRIVTNPAFSRDALSPPDAIELLAHNLAHAGHEFWTSDLQVPGSLRGLGDRLQGHLQVTDAYLLALADHHKGVLATFDRGMAGLARDGLSSALELVPTK